MLRQHTEKFEAVSATENRASNIKLTRRKQERTPLLDSATTLGKTTRQPTNTPFTPIGHIALEGYPGRDERFNLPAGKTLWVKSLYISAALQSSGLGRAAMAAIESEAAGAPHNCTVIALDTTSDAWQRSERSLATFYDDRGLPRPKVVRTNEEWYRRQGYALMDLPPVQEGKTWAREKGVNGELGFYIWVGPETGEEIRVPAVYMWKSIV